MSQARPLGRDPEIGVLEVPRDAVVWSDWEGIPRLATPCLGLVLRFLCTLISLAFMVFLIATYMVWEAQKPRPSTRSFDVAAFAGYGLPTKIFISVETTELPPPATPRSRPSTTRNKKCTISRDHYEFCATGNTGWYFDTKRGRCVHTDEDKYYDCVDAHPAFNLLSSCEISCLGSNTTACGSTVTLHPCFEEDLDETWFVFDSALNACAQWDHSGGACPPAEIIQNGPKTLAECTSRCLQSSKPECQKTAAKEHCPVDLMKRKWFFSKAIDPAGACYSSNLTVLEGHRCFYPRALFRTREDCELTCPTVAAG